MVANFPQLEDDRLDSIAEGEMEVVMGVVSGIRNIRGEMNVPPSMRVDVLCLCEQEAEAALLHNHAVTIEDLARLGNLRIGRIGELRKPRVAASTIVKGIEVYVILQDILDFDSESKRLQKELGKLEKEYGLVQKKLSNEDFLSKAPAEVVEKEREKEQRLGEKVDKLRLHNDMINALRESAAAGE